MGEAYIVAATRTAGGKRGGLVSGWHPADLAGEVLNGLLDRSGTDPALVEDVIMGCVIQAGEQSLNIARGAVMSSKLPLSCPGTSVDRQCGSSQQALHFAAATVMSGAMDVVIAAGVESMSRVPMGLSSVALKDHGTAKGPRQEARWPGIVFSQFTGAELLAEKHQLTKDQLDEYAYNSHKKAAAATKAGKFEGEILSIDVTLPDGTKKRHTVDEGIRFDASLDAIKSVKLLKEGGRITAATSSQICDGAAALLIANERGLMALGAEPLARIHHMTATGGDPVIMLEEPLFATERALKKSGMKIDDIDLYEVNEAFAPVPIAWLRHTDADPAKLNVNGGAIALGHPLGGTGAKLMTTLIHALKDRGRRYGLQTMCEGGGMANVTIVERL